MNFFTKLKVLVILVFFFITSCVSKKQVLYVQDLNTTDVSEITFLQNTFQENDILKIDVTSLEAESIDSLQ